MYHYYAFNLAIHSEMRFPELLPLSDFVSAHTHIKFGKVCHQGLNLAQKKGLFYQATESEIWLNVKDVARFLIAHGNRITIDPAPSVDEDSLRIFILGSCMGALLMQRNLLILHGNAVKIGKQCVSFVGDSRSGKSTLSGAFFKRGHSILADDVCAINAEGKVLPSFPQIKLWLDSANYLAIETQSLRKIRPGIEKFAIPLNQQFYTDMLPLNVIYCLHKHGKDNFTFETINGAQKLQLLHYNTYRKSYLSGLNKEKSHFLQCSKLANQAAVVKITRPSQAFKLNELVDLIEHDLLNRSY